MSMKLYEFVSVFNQLGYNLLDKNDYLWRMGDNIKDAFQSSFDHSRSGFNQDAENNFKNIFEDGQSLLGIKISGNSNSPNEIHLYKKIDGHTSIYWIFNI